MFKITKSRNISDCCKIQLRFKNPFIKDNFFSDIGFWVEISIITYGTVMVLSDYLQHAFPPKDSFKLI